MKPFLLTLLLAGTAWGQTRQDSVRQELKEASARVTARLSFSEAPKEIYRIDSSFSKSKWTEHPATQSIVVFVSLWREYKAECWADSSEDFELEPMSRIVCDTLKLSKNRYELRPRPQLGIYQPLILKRVWIHRKPTAEGFLDWLSERIKR